MRRRTFIARAGGAASPVSASRPASATLDDPAMAPRIERAVRDKIAMLGSWDSVQMSSASSADYAWVAGGRRGTLAGQRSVEPGALLRPKT